MDYHSRNRKIFGFLLLAVQVAIIIFYGIFVRTEVHNVDTKNTDYYPMYQDVNVMMLIGFGFLMNFIKNHEWSALSYTFFINAVIVQLYILWAPFWHNVFKGHWGDKIYLVEKSFTAASYSVASVLIAFGAVLGRVGPLELLIMGLVQIIGYTLNEQIVYERIGVFDAGGSTAIHTFGAYFGLAVSLVLSRVARPKNKPVSDYNSNIFAMIGTLFLWMFWPSFNAGYFSTSPYEKSTIIGNTIIALTGSCLGSFIMTALFNHKFDIEDILNASLAGGVAIGAPSGVFTNAAGPLCIGLFAGVISGLGFKYLQEFLTEKIGLDDSCGVHNLHGIPGILGGIFSAIAIAAYSSDAIKNPTQSSYLPFYPIQGTELNIHGRNFYQQGGCQIAAIFISMGIGIGFGIIAGFLIRIVYKFTPEDFNRDDLYFDHADDQELEKIKNYANETP